MDDDAEVVQAAETPRGKKSKKSRVQTTPINTDKQDFNSDVNLYRCDDLSSVPNVSKEKKSRKEKKMSSSIVSDINGISNIVLPDSSSDKNDDQNPECRESKSTDPDQSNTDHTRHKEKGKQKKSRKKKTISNPDRCIQEGSGHAIISDLQDSNSGIRPTADPDQSNVDHTRHKEKGKKKNRNNSTSISDNFDGYTLSDSNVTLDLDQSNIEQEHPRPKKSKKREQISSTSFLDDVDGNTFADSNVTLDLDQSNIEQEHPRPKKSKKREQIKSTSFLDDVDSNTFADSNVTLDLEQSNIEHPRLKESKNSKHIHSTSFLDDIDGNTYDNSNISLDLEQSNTEHPRFKEGKKRKLYCNTSVLDFVDSNTFSDSLLASTPVSGVSKQRSSKKCSRSIATDISGSTLNSIDIKHTLIDHLYSFVQERGITGEGKTATKNKPMASHSPKRVKAITDLVNQSVSDRQLGEEIQEMAHERMEELVSIRDESFDMLSKLTIVVPYKEHPSRKFETTMGKPTSADAKEQIASMGLEMKTGKFNLKEDNIIKENWEEFARNYRVGNPQYFVRFRNSKAISGLPIKERRNFVRYLARGLEHRYLQCIYKRFQHLFKAKPESGKFSEEEDKLILNYLSLDIKNPYHMIALVLQRDRLAVYRRCKLLRTLAELEVKDTVIKWDLVKKAELVKALLKATNSERVKNLRGMHITGDIWTEVAKDMGIRSRKVEHAWNQRLYTQLFAKKPLFLHKMCIKILELLYIPKKQPRDSDLRGVNLLNWLRQDADNNDYEFQVMRRMLLTNIREFQQGSRRNNIDTRTFTRPKKQMSRPGLRTMVDSPLSVSREQMPPLSESLSFSENIDDISMPINISSYSSASTVAHESTYLNDNFQRHEERGLNTTFQQVENTRNIMFHKLEDTGLRNSKLRRSEEMKLHTLYQNESPRLNTTFSKILSEPHLNISTELRVLSSSPGRRTLGQQKMNSNPDALNLTFDKSESSVILTKPRGLANTMMRKMIELNTTFSQEDFASPPNLNGTFRVPSTRGSPRNKRAASCDSLDDDYSSTSDNSINTNNRLMNAGDVQNIARLQEESLHQVMSTPRSNYHRDVLDEDLPSPIYSHRADINQGYQSDHSDHSSLAKSSRSSQLSSPSSSLHGSTNMLANENAKLGLKLELPKMKPLSAAASAARAKSRPASGLRPPATRTNQAVGSSGLPRPTTHIPRPQSRIPAPKTRKPVSESRLSNNKNNWMDGCY